MMARPSFQRPFLLVSLAFMLTVGSPALARPQGLAELYATALGNNPNLKSREFDVDRARAESDRARSRLLPQILATGERNRNEQKESGSIAQRYEGRRTSLTARQSLYDAPAFRRMESTSATVAQREQELVLTQFMLFDELLDRYLQALYAQDAIASLAAESKATARQVDRLRAMRERQMAKVTDLAEAEAYALGLVTRAIDARNEQGKALARLTELTGRRVTHVLPLVRHTFEPLSESPDERVDAALRNHPRLLALGEAVQAARHDVEASRAEHLPQLTTALSRVYANTGYDNRRAPSYATTTLSIELRVPLYEGGRVDASVREQVARLGVAEQQFEAARREIENEVLMLWSSAHANHARMDSTAAEVQALEQTVTAQERALELGVSQINDVLIARQRLLKAVADRSKARYDFIRDMVALKLRSGELSEADVVLWDSWFGSATL